jgi:NADPH2:quinone reductase
VAYGDGVVDRIRAAAPNRIDGALDLVGGAALRLVGGLVPAGPLYSVANKPLVKQLTPCAARQDVDDAWGRRSPRAVR